MIRMNSRLILRLLKEEQKRLEDPSSKGVEAMFMTERIKEQISMLEASVQPRPLLQNEGGEWLGTIREWIQREALNGESVIWGSHEYLKLQPQSVSDMENLAARIAAAAINEFKRS